MLAGRVVAYLGALTLVAGLGCGAPSEPIHLPPEETLSEMFGSEFGDRPWFGRVKSVETYEDSLTLRTDLRLDSDKDLEFVRRMCSDVRAFLEDGNYSGGSVYVQGKTAEDYGFCESF